jgi:tRNA pseudouridine55 synthase
MAAFLRPMRAISTDALLLVDKPAGVTSHDVVALARRALGTRKVGHGGTLDPFATGLLVLLAGRGTRLLRFVPGEPKVYLATIRLGAETDTDDGTGTITRQAPLPDPAQLRAALAQFTGDITQVPPAYSAKHVDGRRAYDIARQGGVPALAAVPVHVSAWEIVEQHVDALVVRIRCSGGTYIRALARDLGRAVGSAAHLVALRREQVGPFHVADANDLAALRDRTPRVLELREALGDMPTLAVDDALASRVRQGRSFEAEADGEQLLLVDASGDVVAVTRREGALWHPDVVLAAP